MTTKLRFAPSPTGALHVGGARSALFNYFLAKKTGGEFLLRIEDTDRERSKKEHEEGILHSLKWLGCEWDGEPVYQSANKIRHVEVAQELLKKGLAYKCYCSPEELVEMREKAKAESRPQQYDRRCRDREDQPDKPYAIRFQSKIDGEAVLKDLIKGEIRLHNKEIEDFVLLRADGSPTYMLGAAVDDVDMGITHVVRGDDHLNNAFKQKELIEAWGKKAPEYAHIPMVLGPDKAKLSKRHGAVAVGEYKKMGFLPEAVVNALIRLGWSHGDQEIFSAQEISELFSLEACGRSASVFELERLKHLNQHWMKQRDPREMVDLIRSDFGVDLTDLLQSESGKDLLAALTERAETLADFKELSIWLTSEDFPIDEKLKADVLDTIEDKSSAALKDYFKKQEAINPASLFPDLKALSKELGVKVPLLAKPLRVALTGTMQSPDLGLVAAYLGPEKVLQRLERHLG